MNPSAFQFVPGQVRGNAQSFQPQQQYAGQPGQPQAGAGQQGPPAQGGYGAYGAQGAPYAQYGQYYGAGYGAQPGYAPYGQQYGGPAPAHFQQQPPAQWDAPSEPEPAPEPAKMKMPVLPPPREGKTFSLSIGGASKPPAAAKDNAPAPKPAQPAAKPASAAPAAAPAKAAAPAPKPAAPAVAAPAAPAASTSSSASAAPRSGPSSGTATPNAVAPDAVLKQVESVDEEALADLYGDMKDAKSHCNIVFIGHVDAGKSTMGGNILFITGMVDKRTMEKYEREAKEAGRESWYLSWALDSTIQERDKGKTVEVGRAFFETDKRRYTILDAPGHKTYVPSMISGASQADVAVLVISARKGEFETGFERGGQTREHAMLVKTAGVQRLIVAVNKMDDPTVKWDKERWDDIQNKLGPFLKGTGFGKNDVTWIPLSGYTGANLKDRVKPDVCSWYSGPSLLEYLDGMALVDRKLNAPLLMPVSEKYNDLGTILVGKIEAGRLRKGSSLLLMPNKTRVEVLAIFGETEEEIPHAMAGDNVRIRVRGVDDSDVAVGFVLCDVAKPVHVTTQFEAQLVILDSKNIICSGYSAVLHVHTLAEEISLGALLHYFDKATGRKSKKPPQFAKKGQKIIARVEVAAPICIERFDEHPQLGRFTLRDEGKTIAIGKVTKLLTRGDEVPDVSGLSVSAAPNGA